MLKGRNAPVEQKWKPKGKERTYKNVAKQNFIKKTCNNS
jgi:hypothetical protein